MEIRFESFINENFNINHVIVKIDSEEEYNILMEYLEKIGILWKSGDVPKSIKYNKNSIRIRDGRLTRAAYEYYLDNLDGAKIVNVEDVLKGKKFKKIEHPDDPFGEEDWGYVQESLDSSQLVDNCIVINNETEYNIVMDYFDKIGLKWLSGSAPKYRNFKQVSCIRNTPFYIIVKLDNNHIRFGTSENPKGNIFTHDMLFNFKFKKIENPEIDPFGEEDWGYEIQD